MTANAIQSYEALLEHEIMGHQLAPGERIGIEREIGRLEKKKWTGGRYKKWRTNNDREDALLARYKAAIERRSH